MVLCRTTLIINTSLQIEAGQETDVSGYSTASWVAYTFFSYIASESSSYRFSGTDATQSVTSSVRDYVYDNGIEPRSYFGIEESAHVADAGRRYHRYGGEGKYMLPNDEVSMCRFCRLGYPGWLRSARMLMISRPNKTASIFNITRALSCTRAFCTRHQWWMHKEFLIAVPELAFGIPHGSRCSFFY